jgi:hypothetical protein
MAKYRRLWDTYWFPGFRANHTVSGIFGDPKARVIRLVRRGKKQFAELAVVFISPFTTGRSGEFETSLVGTCESTWTWKSGG